MNRALGLSVLAIATVAWAVSASAGDGPASATALVTPPDVQATLFAAEPLLSSPADIDVDARGRLWDGRLAAWLAKTAVPQDAAARAIVWRSRAAASATLQRRLIGDPQVTPAESLALIRAVDFQDQARAAAAVRGLLKDGLATVSDEKRRIILPELVMRLEPAATDDPTIAARIAEAADMATGARPFIDIVRRFTLKSRWPDVVALAAAEGTGEQLAAAAAATPDVKAAAVRALARSQSGAKALVRMAESGTLTGQLPRVAAVAVASCPWADVRTAAAAVLPMPKAKEGTLPPVAELVKKAGDADRGRLVFAGAGTCAKGHVVGADGKAVGPNLSGIGGKLSRTALYEAILAPSAAISHSYETYTAVLDDGRSLTGLLVSESPEEVVIRGADGIDVTTPAGEIEELVRQPVSLMPADLAATLSTEQLVDLVSWLETLKQAN